ncbi:MAG: SPFH domain-containing protein [Syntrophales bacterium]|nr:SPFH domain-containing protein [Syntrophales bacterium]
MMGTDNIVFLEVIEWFEKTGKELVHRIPQKGSGEIKFGAQLTVRESQAAVFFYNGRALDAFGPGRHTLKTANIPILTKLLSLPWGMTSPLRAEVYFTNMRVFPNLKWGTRDPVAFRDSELGLIRLRAFGIFNIRILQPVLFINSLVGTQGIYTTEEIEEYLSRVIVSRFNDFMGENIDTIFNLPARYNEFSEDLKKLLQDDFSRFGLGLTDLYINSITPPPDVQKAIDDKSRLGVFDDLNKLIKMKAAMAMETAAQAQGEAGAGMGLGMGFMMPAMFADTFRAGTAPQGQQAAAEESGCPGCGQGVPREARFCPHCGNQIVVFQQCSQCNSNLPADARFCLQCGRPVEAKAQARTCSKCGYDNIFNAAFCNQCGERIS